jgi:predicted transcriptional regulator
MNDDPPGGNLALTTEIVAAFVANHAVALADLPALITGVFRSLNEAGRVEEVAPERPQPAVSVRKSVQQDFIVCLEDGKRMKAAEAVPGHALQPDARRVPAAVGPAGRLPDGGARLRRAPLDDGQAVRPGP